jgi:sugar (pentulose or hexulose) kinase
MGWGGAYAYIDAYGEGLTVLEWRDKNARNEMKMLSAELEGILELNINVNKA